MPQLQKTVGEKPRPTAGKAVPVHGAFRAPVWTTDVLVKRVCCKTCDGRGCVGRCRY
jgi:hypothetical protein